MKAAVVVFPGSNRENDIKDALAQSMGREPTMVWHRDTEMPEVDLIVVPGGFSYGDYLRCGAIAANSPVMREVAARAKKGVAKVTLAAARKGAAGGGRTRVVRSVPMFVGISTVRLRKRFGILAIVRREAAHLAELYAKHLRTDG